MSRLTRLRMARVVIASVLFASAVATPALAAPAPQPLTLRAVNQDQPATEGLTGFGELPDGATLISSASGELDPAVDAPAALQIERFEVAPGDTVPEVDGPQIIQVEQGTLTFEDDLGLEAEMDAGTAQFFAAGQVGPITNASDEPTILVRTILSGDAAPNDDENSDNDGQTGERPQSNHSGDDTAGISALYAQSTPAPSEIVLTLTDDGFDPEMFEIVQGGELVIENATEDACLFEIPDLDIETDIDAGDIESVDVDGSAGIHEFSCTVDGDEQPVGEGSFFLARPESTPAPAASPVPDESPAASPAPDESPAASPTPETANATPAPDETETPTTTEETAGEIGVLLDSELDTMPGGDQQLFAAQIVLDPGATLAVSDASDAIGVVVSGGDLTVDREGRAPSKLRDGRSVLLPGVLNAELTNNGDTPITLQVAGVSGTEGADSGPTDEPTAEPTDEATEEPTEEPVDNGPVDTSGANRFLPTDAEMENLGLLAQRGEPTEITEPTDNAFWFDDADQAEELLPTFDWQGALQNLYDSDREETEFGEVEVLAVFIDTFGDADGAADYFTYIDDDIFGGSGRSSDAVEELPDVTDQMFATIFDSEQELDVGFMVIQSDEFVVTLYTRGPDLDATAMMEAVATLIFGPRG